jgi:signal transduction histidine kinase
VLSRGFPVRREPGGPVVRIVGTHFDLTERKQAEDLLRRSHEELEIRVRERTAELAQANESLRGEIGERERAERARTELLGRLVFAQEDERRRIAREMHDQFGEQLTALAHRIASVESAAAGRPELRSAIGALQQVAQQIDRDVEHLVWELRPTALDDLGLQAALSNYVQTWSARTGVAAELRTSGLRDDRLASEVETTLYRIAQEALTNVARHAGAKQVVARLERDGPAVVLRVEDDGRGPPAGAEPTSGLGLLGMRERAAQCGGTASLERGRSGGSALVARLPLASAAAPRGPERTW